MSKDVRIFLDSNVILSGLISSQGAPRILLDLLSLEIPLLKGMTGQYNVEEIERNLSRRFPKLLPLYREYFPRLKLDIIEIPTYEIIEPLLPKMSPKDAPVLASARLGGADYLVTGNKKDFPVVLLKPIQLVNPSEFLNEVLPRIVQSDI